MEGECSTSAGGPSGPAVQFAKQDGLDRQEAEHRERLAGEKQKLGHRRIDELGEVSYKKVPTNALMSAIQLGIANSIGSLASYPQRDLLVQDFDVIETVAFPTIGSQTTPSHPYGDFRFKTYAPIAFRYFRELFHIKPADFLRSICTDPLKELSNAGASGSIFYVSHDDNFIIKTVQHKEAEFLQKLLPGYYMNINQNPRTLLPKFFGLFCYQSLGKNIRLLVMNNLLPQAITMHEKYDLKGSTYKRLASKAERAKAHPTLKDLDFVENHKNGLDLEPSVYDALLSTLQRDALVLEAFKIMDYSLLVGIHNVDIQEGTQGNQLRSDSEDQDDGDMPSTSRTGNEHKALKSKFSVWEGMKGSTSNSDAVTAFGGVPARNANGDRIILFLGIIDILQNYRLLKKFEHTWKSILHDGDTISVHNPKFYAQRFLSFMEESVFKKLAVGRVATGIAVGVAAQGGKFRTLVHSFLALKHSPSRRRAPARRSLGEDEPATPRDVVPSMVRGTVRRSYNRQDTQELLANKPKEKKVERLFGGSTSARTDPSTSALAEEPESEVTRL